MPIQTEEVGSSLPLQMLIYFNGYYSIMFVVMSVFLTFHRLDTYMMDPFFRLLIPVVTVIWVICEPVRLYFGWSGNLTENVPGMSAFCLLTAFPVLPCTLFLAFGQAPFLPFDTAVGVPMIVFLLLEFLVSAFSLRKLIEKQTAKFFQLLQEEDIGGVGPGNDGGHAGGGESSRVGGGTGDGRGGDGADDRGAEMVRLLGNRERRASLQQLARKQR